MKKKKTLALLGCSALLLSGMYFSNSKNQNSNNIDDKRNFYGTLEENGDIIDWNDFYWEFNSVVEPQLVAGHPEFSHQVLATAHRTRLSTVNFEERRQ